MKVHRGLFNWGIFLLVLASVPLAVQWGYLDAASARELLRFWPLILVGIGLGLILRLTPFGVLGGALAAGTAGLLVGALLAGGVGGIGGACIGAGEHSTSALETRSGSFSATTAHLQMELTCAEVNVTRAPGSEWSVEADFAGGNPPQLDATADRLSLRSTPGRFFLGGEARRELNVRLPQEQAISLSTTVNASRGTLALGSGPLASLSATLNGSEIRVELPDASAQRTSLSLTFNASSGTITLPTASALDGNMTLNASSVTLCAEPEAALRLSHTGTLSSANFEDAGLSRSGDVWQTPGFEGASARSELRLTSNVSSITLDRTGGCQ
jgi:hypothetical protein